MKKQTDQDKHFLGFCWSKKQRVLFQKKIQKKPRLFQTIFVFKQEEVWGNIDGFLFIAIYTHKEKNNGKEDVACDHELVRKHEGTDDGHKKVWCGVAVFLKHEVQLAWYKDHYFSPWPHCPTPSEQRQQQFHQY